jgi:hypothetical protein
LRARSLPGVHGFSFVKLQSVVRALPDVAVSTVPSAPTRGMAEGTDEILGAALLGHGAGE